ncbi:MAG: histidine kinase [Nocardioidaceae bacterium]|nr:histidine kinase [Nocardioidaceae bacterium]
MTTPQVMGQSSAGRFGPLIAGIWLFFLIDPILAGLQAENRVRGWSGVATTVIFGGLYMSLWWRMRIRARSFGDDRRNAPGGAASLLLGLLGLGVAMVLLVGEPGIACSVYIAVTAVMVLPPRWSAPVVVAIAVTVTVLGLLPGWGFEFGTAFAVLAAAVAVFGLRLLIRRNAELVEAHETIASLAVDNERSRFARDLHDILGHSLTVITIKAELTGRLLDVDPDRARAEVASLEQLSRDALADVRRAVEGYRDLTLPGEITRARTALAAAQIAASLPGSADEVPTQFRELFAWAIRESVTNVVRHSGARHCEVRLSSTTVEVRDDGRGMAPGTVRGSGLLGLQERASAAGATLVTRSLEPGYSVQLVVA